jgi:hypothetical protein
LLSIQALSLLYWYGETAMTVISVKFNISSPSGPPYLDGRNPTDVLQLMLDTQLADGKTVREVARQALSGDEKATIRLGYLGLRCENKGIAMASPALFSRALPVVHENGGLHAFHSLGSIAP